ncbi:hypothetical protein FIBSPDRAFT_891102 [Athelia psychrophila]|uniref:Uncharacterized protein n=1 Tax=Athelia psychrophila TaxID=1759441 RepID=A0A166K065_9AGAM|nr:hypothetical protein FIBSPDRAFT_891102 [Fibularhizoctonia sp. CBS 109695]
MGLPQNLEEMENCKPTFATTDTSGGSVTNINGDCIKGQRLEVNGNYIAYANVNVNPPDPKEQKRRFRPNPPPDLISLWVFVICLICLWGLVIQCHPRGAFVLYQTHVAHVRHMTNVVPIRTDVGTFGWTPEWLTQEADRSLANLQEVNRALAQLYLLLENKLSVHVGTSHSGKDAKGMFTGSDVGPELARVPMCRARSEGGKGGDK